MLVNSGWEAGVLLVVLSKVFVGCVVELSIGSTMGEAWLKLKVMI